MCFKFVVGSLPCSERFFSGYLGFPSTFKFQFNMECMSTCKVFISRQTTFKFTVKPNLHRDAE